MLSGLFQLENAVIHVRRNICVCTTVLEESAVLPTDKYLVILPFLQGNLHSGYSWAGTGVLLGVGHKLKGIITVSGEMG